MVIFRIHTTHHKHDMYMNGDHGHGFPYLAFGDTVACAPSTLSQQIPDVNVHDMMHDTYSQMSILAKRINKNSIHMRSTPAVAGGSPTNQPTNQTAKQPPSPFHRTPHPILYARHPPPPSSTERAAAAPPSQIIQYRQEG